MSLDRHIFFMESESLITHWHEIFILSSKHKAMKKLILVIMITCIFAACNNSQQQALESYQKQRTIDSLNTVLASQRIIDSMKAVRTSHERGRVSSAGYDAVSNQTTGPEAPPKKKGWSGAAKGAVIGAGAGAIAGAIIDKKHGEGAIVGGLLGAGVGAGTGAIIDNNKKKKDAKPANSNQ